MAITPQEALARVIVHREIFFDEMVDLMRQVMRGEVSPVMTAAVLTGLRVKKETVGEIAAAAQVMREFSTKVQVADHAHLLDTCGTGGDGRGTFDVRGGRANGRNSPPERRCRPWWRCPARTLATVCCSTSGRCRR